MPTTNKTIPELTELAVMPANNDLLAIVDVSDTTDSASGTTKKIQFSTLETLASANTQVLYNNAGALGGDAGMTYVAATDILTLVGALVSPTITGGTATTSDLNLKTTSGVGITGADMHFLVGNNGATEAATILNSGKIGLNTLAPLDNLSIVGDGSTIEATFLSAGGYPPQLGIYSSSANNTGLLIRRTTTDVEINMLAEATSGFVGTSTNHPFNLRSNNTVRLTCAAAGAIGMAGATTPTNDLSLGGNAARIMWLERHTTADTAGNTLTVQAGGATAAATNKAGGDLILQPGVSTGSAESGVQIKGCVAGAGGTIDRTLTTAVQVLGNKLSFYAGTPVVRGAALTAQLTTITCSAPGTPDYAIANLTASAPYGFVSADEGQSVLKVIANLQVRVAELEARLGSATGVNLFA